MNEFITYLESKKLFSRAVAALVVFAAAYFLVLAVNEFRRGGYIGQEPGIQNTIVVSGAGEATAVPDIATISFSVSEEKTTVADAQAAVSERMEEIRKFLEGSDVSERDIKTTSYNIYPKYEYVYPREIVPCTGVNCPPYPPREQRVRGYEVTDRVEIKVRDLELLGDLVAGIGQLEVTNLSGPNFEVEDPDAVLAEAREEAILKAREKAEELADELGVRLVRIVSFNEGRSGLPYDYAPRAAIAEGFGSDTLQESVQVSPGENKYNVSVNIVYQIR